MKVLPAAGGTIAANCRSSVRATEDILLVDNSRRYYVLPIKRMRADALSSAAGL